MAARGIVPSDSINDPELNKAPCGGRELLCLDAGTERLQCVQRELRDQALKESTQTNTD